MRGLGLWEGKDCCAGGYEYCFRKGGGFVCEYAGRKGCGICVRVGWECERLKVYRGGGCILQENNVLAV